MSSGFGLGRTALTDVAQLQDVVAAGAADRSVDLAGLHLEEDIGDFLIELIGPDPADEPALGGGRRLGELLREPAELRPLAQLIHQALGGLARRRILVGLIGGNEDLGDLVLRLVEALLDPAHLLVDVLGGDIDRRGELVADQLLPGDLGCGLVGEGLLDQRILLDGLVELLDRHVVGGGDLGKRPLDLGLRRRDALALRLRLLQLVVDQGPQHLRREAGANLRAVLEAHRLQHQLEAHQQVDLGNRLVIDHGDDIEAVLRRRDPGSDGGGQENEGKKKTQSAHGRPSSQGLFAPPNTSRTGQPQQVSHTQQVRRRSHRPPGS